jgi:hypothetical protein
LSDDDETKWLLPTQIPFDELKGRALEECLFWLLDGMGARDIEWRIGGKGAGAADGGRDIEARFFVPNTDGQIGSGDGGSNARGVRRRWKRTQSPPPATMSLPISRWTAW